jgi:arginase family enzyme
VRRQSWTFGAYNHALGLEIFDILQVLDGGDVEVGADQAESTLRLVQERTYGLSRGGHIPGIVGGTSLVTLGALRGIVQAKRRPVTFLHLTASHGLRRDSTGEGGMVRLAQEQGLLKKGGVLQVGVRGPCFDADESQDAFRGGFERLTIDNVRWDIHAAMEGIRNVTGGHTVYVSVDLASLDPSVCPGVTRPVPGGLSSWEVQQVLRSLVGADIVGFDVVGMCPSYDTSALTSIMAVAVLHELLSVVAESRDNSRVSLIGGSSGRTSA